MNETNRLLNEKDVKKELIEAWHPSWGVSIEELKCIVDEVPTAYNPDKVVEQLERNCHNYYPSSDHYCCSQKAVKLSDAIEIVKGGGIDE